MLHEEENNQPRSHGLSCLFAFLRFLIILMRRRRPWSPLKKIRPNLEDFNNGKKADIIIYVDTTTSIREGLTARCGFASKFNRLSLIYKNFLI